MKKDDRRKAPYVDKSPDMRCGKCGRQYPAFMVTTCPLDEAPVCYYECVACRHKEVDPVSGLGCGIRRSALPEPIDPAERERRWAARQLERLAEERCK